MGNFFIILVIKMLVEGFFGEMSTYSQWHNPGGSVLKRRREQPLLHASCRHSLAVTWGGSCTDVCTWPGLGRAFFTYLISMRERIYAGVQAGLPLFTRKVIHFSLVWIQLVWEVPHLVTQRLIHCCAIHWTDRQQTVCRSTPTCHSLTSSLRCF